MVRCLFVLLILAIAASAASWGQDWPNRPVRFIVPYPAGGSTDIAARPIADYLSRALGQQVYVENKSGAAGIVGVEAGAKSAPDGYTILIAPDFVSSAPHIFKLSIDPLKDLVPVIQISRQPVALAVHPSLGVSSLAEFIALAKQRPGLSFASSGVGSQQQMVAEGFKAGRHQARTCAVSRRRPGDQRSGRRPCAGRVTRLVPARPALQGRNPAHSGAIDGDALAEPAGRADL